MSILRSAVEHIVGGIKSDPRYRMSSQLSDAQLAIVVWHRGRQALRGLSLPLRPGVRGPVFRGRRVVVEHVNQLSCGPGLVLEDGAFLNALGREGIVLGRNVTIGRGASLVCTGVVARPGVGIRIGDRSAIGAGSFVGGQGGIVVGDDVIMGPGVRIFSENHRFDSIDRTIREQGEERSPVRIDDDCWIGGGATILAGVSIGEGCVIAAGAVVTRDVPPYSVVAGVPARVLKSRRPDAAVTPEAALPPSLMLHRGQLASALREDR